MIESVRFVQFQIRYNDRRILKRVIDKMKSTATHCPVSTDNQEREGMILGRYLRSLDYANCNM